MAILNNTQLHGRVDVLDGNIKIHGGDVRWELDATNPDMNMRMIAYDAISGKKLRELTINHKTGEITTTSNIYHAYPEYELTEGSTELEIYTLAQLNSIFGVTGANTYEFGVLTATNGIYNKDVVVVGTFWRDNTLYAKLNASSSGHFAMCVNIFYTPENNMTDLALAKTGIIDTIVSSSNQLQIKTLTELNTMFGVEGYTEEHFGIILSNSDVSLYDIGSISPVWDNEVLYARFGEAINGNISINYMIFFTP